MSAAEVGLPEISLIEVHSESSLSYRARSAPVALPTAYRVFSENPRPDLRRLRRAPGRGSLSLCLQFEALDVCVCLFDCLFLCVPLSLFG